MGILFKMAQPMIPSGLLHTMYEIRASGHYDQSKGGQWVQGEEERVAFEGAVLPVSDRDLRREITGTVSDLSEKIYTNGHALKTGAQVYDPDSGNTYTVTQELGHNSIHPMKRYLVEARTSAAPKGGQLRMSFVQKRNALISALHKVVGVPVLLASQVQPEADPPFIIYSVTADYIPDGSLGHYSLEEGATPDDLVSARVEQPTATLSFTACSINRCYDDNGVQVEVLGADEALELATLAQGFFLHTGRDAISDAGFVVVDISNATSRDALELDEMGRRFGFDVRLRYTRSDHAAVSEVEQPNIIGTVKE